MYNSEEAECSFPPFFEWSSGVPQKRTVPQTGTLWREKRQSTERCGSDHKCPKVVRGQKRKNVRKFNVNHESELKCVTEVVMRKKSINLKVKGKNSDNFPGISLEKKAVNNDGLFLAGTPEVMVRVHEFNH